MARFVVRHQHDADRCPAADPHQGATLLNYLSRPRARQHGIEIQSEAVVRGEHTLYIIVESEDEGRGRSFMQPFALAGRVDIYPAATCAGVVAEGGCAAPAPAVDDMVAPFGPAEAGEPPIEAGPREN